MNAHSDASPLRVLFVTDHPEEGASSRFRIYQFLPILELQNIQCRVVPFTSQKLYRLIHERGHHLEKWARASASSLRRIGQLATIGRYNLVFLHREAFPFGPPAFEILLRSLSRRLVFDFDDAIGAGHADTDRLPNPLLYRLKYGRQTHRVVAAADLVVAGNRILADYARKFNSRVEIVPTVVDTFKYSYREPEARKSPLVVGWMGSPSTSPYLDLLGNVFRELKSRFRERISFAIFGAPDYKPVVEDTVVKPFNLETEIADFRLLDIGVMPLPDNEWTQGKCAFKAIQYMSLGIPAVCSPVGVTPDLVADGENGFLCSTETEWVEKLSALIQSVERRRWMAFRARAKIEAEYSLKAWSPVLARLLRRVASTQNEAEGRKSTL